LAGRFGLQNLIGAAVAQITDMNTESKKDLGTSASRMNGISGEDGQTVERKGIGDWNGKLSARFQIAGNNLPNFGTNTGAMATRLLILPFDVSFAGREDRGLTDKLIAELPGILNWCLAGLDRLRARGDFAEPPLSLFVAADGEWVIWAALDKLKEAWRKPLQCRSRFRRARPRRCG